MTIRVRLFAVLRDRAGLGEAMLELTNGATVFEAVAALQLRFPGLAADRLKVAFAVNSSYVPVDHILQAGDELALIPPVSGG